ncbi:beta-phosphoglucomutase [Rossellomorea sp. AcN35-11]|nr:beta-phosphoglucomutase [Rossellomorea aquimaris]WJV30624.1 beta-phosphoglucomutase [Rossellomorea sp. AcN35-11]
MTKPLQGVIFDMDGVITDTMPFYFQANQELMRPFGIRFTEEQNNKLKGIGRRETVQYLLKEANVEVSDQEIAALAEKRNEIYLSLLSNLSPRHVLPGIIEFLEELKMENIPVALASSSQNGPYVLKKVGLREYFPVVIDPTTVKKGKPDPEIFLRAAHTLGVDEEGCAGIEDGEAGLKALLHTNMFTVGVGADDYMKYAHWTTPSTRELSLKTLIERMKKG